MWAVEAWLIRVCEIQDPCLAGRTKRHRQDSYVALSAAFLIEIEWASTNTALSKGSNLIL